MIESQAQILRSQGHEVQIASGGPLEEWAKPGVVLPELDYRTEGTIPVERLLEQKADLWIIHNPTLGLNIDYPKMIEIAARAGVPMLMQIHDFVEDGRPENYQLVIGNQRLYPNAQHVHYATINRRDLGILKAAGVPDSRVHFLPNAVNKGLVKILDDIETYHATPIEAAKAANLANVDHLMFYHLTPAPRNNLMERMFFRGVDEIRKAWSSSTDGTMVVLPLDSDEIIITEIN